LSFILGSVSYVVATTSALAGFNISIVNAVKIVAQFWFLAGVFFNLFAVKNTRVAYTNLQIPRNLSQQAKKNRNRNIDFWAVGFLFVGVSFFLIHLVTGLSIVLRENTELRYLVIDFSSLLGSLCFLIGTYLGFIETVHGFFKFTPQRLDWWSTSSFVVGSLFLLIGALTGFFSPPLSGPIFVDTFVLIAVLFFGVGSYLGLLEIFN